MPSDWPFSDPPDVAVFTRQVFRSGRPILHVSHDADDGALQFHDSGTVSEADAMVVALQGVLARDGSIANLADLPLGWYAERASVDQPWVRYSQPPFDKALHGAPRERPSFLVRLFARRR